MMQSTMSSAYYGKGYWEDAEGSNYRNYGDDPGWPVIASLIEHLSNGNSSTVYEVACAKGYLVNWLNNFGLDAYGIDISDYAIENSVADIRSRLSVANAVSLPWDTDTADYVLSMEFFEHVPENEIDNVLSEKMRVLKSGGLMLMKINIDDHQSSSESDNDHSHFTIMPREWWESIFEKSGLVRDKNIEDMLDYAFSNRDWKGRFFAWRKI
jgi:SAM-dependent methyltransferase